MKMPRQSSLLLPLTAERAIAEIRATLAAAEAREQAAKVNRPAGSCAGCLNVRCEASGICQRGRDSLARKVALADLIASQTEAA